jgi:hypothetical protein
MIKINGRKAAPAAWPVMLDLNQIERKKEQGAPKDQSKNVNRFAPANVPSK